MTTSGLPKKQKAADTRRAKAAKKAAPAKKAKKSVAKKVA